MHLSVGTVAAFISAVALTVYAVSEIPKGHTNVVAPVLGMAAFLAVMGVVAARVYPTVKIVPNHDAQLQQLVVVERRIAQRKRELAALQQQVNQSYTDDSISDDLEPAARIKQYASRTTPS
ncbi:MAG: hypothetical protein U0559_04815 [Anaerolineae bacterium]